MIEQDDTEIKWEFHNPVRMIFGRGALPITVTLVDGRRTLLVTTMGSTRRGVTARIRDLLGQSVAMVVDNVESNPELTTVVETAESLGDLSIDTILAVGGGSVIDTAKILSVILSRREDGFSLRRYLDSGGGVLAGSGIPVIAVPTTAGTGSEVTPFATVWDAAGGRKYSVSGPELFPSVAVLDPLLTLTLSREVTISTGMDAISQALEAVWNTNATPITTSYATEALRIALRVLPSLADRLDDLALRSQMLKASLLSGLAISNTRTAIAHSMSYPLTQRYGVPHGIACGFALPEILEFNAEVDDGRLQRLATGLGRRSLIELQRDLADLVGKLEIKEFILRYLPGPSALLDLGHAMIAPERSANNLREVTQEEITGILEATLSRWGV